MPTEEDFDNVNLSRFKEAYQSAESSGYLPSPEFLDRCEGAFDRAILRRKVLGKMKEITNRVEYQPTFSGYLLELSRAAGQSDDERQLAFGLSDAVGMDTFNFPSYRSEEVASFLEVNSRYLFNCFRVNSIESRPATLSLARKRVASPDSLDQLCGELEEMVSNVRISGRNADLKALALCDEAIASHFADYQF